MGQVWILNYMIHSILMVGSGLIHSHILGLGANEKCAWYPSDPPQRIIFTLFKPLIK